MFECSIHLFIQNLYIKLAGMNSLMVTYANCTDLGNTQVFCLLVSILVVFFAPDFPLCLASWGSQGTSHKLNLWVILNHDVYHN